MSTLQVLILSIAAVMIYLIEAVRKIEMNKNKCENWCCSDKEKPDSTGGV